jgi:hypothetical protein
MKGMWGIVIAGGVALIVPLAMGPAAAASLAVGKKLEIKIDPKKMNDERAALWAKFGGWCAIKEWHPAIADCEESTEGDAKFRTLTLKDGGKIKEKLLDEKPNFYRYEIIESPLPVKNYQAQFTLTPDDDDEDEINFAWSAVFDAADGKTDKEARDTITGIFKDGLDSIKSLARGGGDDKK